MALTYLLPFEIWQEIILYCEFLTAIRLRQLNKWFYKLEIHDFYNIDWKYLNKLSDEILKAYPFIRKLNAYYNEKIKDVNHMTNLKVLNADYDCGISDDGIKQLNLIELSASGNSKIKDVNHLTNLKVLNAGGYYCGISNDGIKQLNLIELFSYGNKKITIKIEKPNT